MPNIKSAQKRVRVTKKKNLRNRMVKTGVKTAVKKYTLALNSDLASAPEKLSAAAAALDRGVAKGVVHKNTANRKKSRMAIALNKAQA
ncbi:MAG: 30S ribosomal protein S20 [Clostridiales bacterium]|nr:30S ribosomal protein S20 [Clostridiales bacterium]